ncbi:Na+/H+ antiporter [Phenylobacterium sp.]|uniref:Na+/H+ antiporter n=1 Tax=Phenylobacterium sp. TaxID=1871053 RepID=UPI00261479EB|nr:Na+/H+ antiporter [Phenylobacterium sp.]
MDVVTTVLPLLLAVALSGMAAQFTPAPLPLLQIGLGVALALIFGLRVRLDPALFFVLLVPPLLFADAWRIPKAEVFRLKGPILTMAIGLVVFTVLGIGWFAHWLVPSLPIAMAFALGAVLSPTDAVALKALAHDTPIPPRLLHILSGEALMNDATGLVCLRFALVAMITGAFSLAGAAFTFVELVAVGLLVGAAAAWLFGAVQSRMVRWGADHSATQVLLGLLLPFAAYLAAEGLHGSGILAAVAAGATRDRMGLRSAGKLATRMQVAAVWDMLEFTLNGLIFLLLGLQAPALLAEAPALARAFAGGHVLLLVGYLFAIAGALLVLRLAWVWASLEFTLYRSSLRGVTRSHPGFRVIAASAVAGVRGAITLAAVLSLPLALPNGAPLPGRDLVVFFAMGVILCSLLTTAVVFPLLLKGLALPDEAAAVAEERRARLALAEAALRQMEEVGHATAAGSTGPERIADAEAGALVMDDYRARLEAKAQTEEARRKLRRSSAADRTFRLAALRAERDELSRLRERAEIGDAGFRKLLHELDLAEAALAGAKGHQ